jgi:hypothetical protein
MAWPKAQPCHGRDLVFPKFMIHLFADYSGCICLEILVHFGFSFEISSNSKLSIFLLHWQVGTMPSSPISLFFLMPLLQSRCLIIMLSWRRPVFRSTAGTLHMHPPPPLGWRCPQLFGSFDGTMTMLAFCIPWDPNLRTMMSSTRARWGHLLPVGPPWFNQDKSLCQVHFLGIKESEVWIGDILW